jgi:hypothetical protein
MGQLYVAVILRNAREYVLAQHGHLTFEAVHTYETPEALIDTGAPHVVLPPHVAEQLGLWRMGSTGARLPMGARKRCPSRNPSMWNSSAAPRRPRPWSWGIRCSWGPLSWKAWIGRWIVCGDNRSPIWGRATNLSFGCEGETHCVTVLRAQVRGLGTRKIL